GERAGVQPQDLLPADVSDPRGAADIHLTPDGRHLYAGDRTSSLITVFSVSEDGSVLSVEGFQPSVALPSGFNIENSG
ncbi:beta-propeller fold lactonase family protein, partial [Salmonella enterica]|uniref:beta-propeller fold lactonase family protein n=1 Tax=Salmonella enterica TaxID=28901 RepID=UPI00329A3499